MFRASKNEKFKNEKKKDNIFEITSSSLNKPIPLSKYSFETDPLLLGSTYNKENYGLIEINSLTREVNLSIKYIDRESLCIWV